jgi:hypothetical protein
VTLGWKQGEGGEVMAGALRAAGFAAYGPGWRFMGRFVQGVDDIRVVGEPPDEDDGADA